MIKLTFLYLPIDSGEALCLIRKINDVVVVQMDTDKMKKYSEADQDRILAHEMKHLMMMDKQ